MTKQAYVFSADTRKIGEAFLLISSLLYATTHLSPLNRSMFNVETVNDWQALGMFPNTSGIFLANGPLCRAPHIGIIIHFVFHMDT